MRYTRCWDVHQGRNGPLWLRVSINPGRARSEANDGVDIDDENVQNAQKTVRANKLESRIKISQTDPSSELIPLQKLGHERFEQQQDDPCVWHSRGTDQTADLTLQCVTLHSIRRARRCSLQPQKKKDLHLRCVLPIRPVHMQYQTD